MIIRKMSGNSAGSKNISPENYRVCVCDCESGRFITSITFKEIEYIYEVIMKSNIKTGDFLYDLVVEGAIEKVIDIKDYLGAKEKEKE